LNVPKKILFVLGGGIGNIVQATPAIQAAYNAGYVVDLYLHCNSSNDLDIFKIPEVRNLYKGKWPNEEYDFQLNGPFTPGKHARSKNVLKTKFNYVQHKPEYNVYWNLIEQIGITSSVPYAKINIGNKGIVPKHVDSVAFYCGSKSRWAMKRWDKYDELSNHFEHVYVVGKSDDVCSHGDPAWIDKKWKWPKHVEFVLNKPLQEMAYFISKCKMFIGNDGGLAHVAAATGIDTFVLFGPSSDIKNKPYAAKSHVIAIDLECRPCQFNTLKKKPEYFKDGGNDCPLHMKCMRDMSVDFVMNKVKQSNVK